MEQAIKQAKLAESKGEVPVGAVIVGADGTLIAAAHNRVIADKDPTAHAEILALRLASRKISSERLQNCDLYVTLEPCAMCAGAISLARIRRVYFGAEDVKSGGTVNGARVFDQKTCHHKPDVYGGIHEQETMKILRDFFEKRR